MAAADTATILDHHRELREAGVEHRFQDLDDPSRLNEVIQAVQSNHTDNFIVEFGEDHAFAGSDFPVISIAALLNAGFAEALSTRWINIWRPQYQIPLLELLARQYDFSPRLLALMASDPRQSKPSCSIQQARPPPFSHKIWRSRSYPTPREVAVEKELDELSEHFSVSSHGSAVQGNLYKIVDDVWHYSSIDFGRSYVCIGFNSLYGTKHSGAADVVSEDVLPHCKRVWTWLLFCADSTVISIHEDPFPFTNGQLDTRQQRILAQTRRNLVNVFRSLSKVGDDDLLSYNPMTLLPIRTRLGDTPEESAHHASDAPGLLFYYLFENWHNSYTLVTRKESRYGLELNKLRAEMFHAPQLCHIDRLDSIGRELSVLKRHYQSYERIIDRLLEPQVATLASLENSRVVSDAGQASLDTMRPLVTEKESLLGVSLTSATRARFKRLKDLIDLYALSEVEEYIKQKEGLVSMNFSLIALKESGDMERLTRVTLLLTKATILFLPVSLMSGYFSINLVNVQYTVAQYWIGFAIIFFLSWVALFVFGVFSGSVQTITFFEGFWQGVLMVQRWVGGFFMHDRSREKGRVDRDAVEA